uniref:Uncharacterized protein n=1 Tax=Chromera velia CCMP2878 TaxID=1169474 RepID=A0A0G4FQN1_9ALVE|eukprot:Cvel_18250.t1-p1 / transcript=Cvel_18250.t1 / gene=Cvel_18250 / organism=Chromera_velia_CCMP2878 / gene_product=hypothetical protein / transcript_product=hypothetical protein / location=Cvel_scaffold1501:32819-34397(-) / protein_length=450 / sequence_SO=supercontig / SO=protein_coding / is_pseudo=false
MVEIVGPSLNGRDLQKRRGQKSCQPQTEVFLPPPEAAVDFAEFCSSALTCTTFFNSGFLSFVRSKGLMDYHLQVTPDSQLGFRMTVQYGEERYGPARYANCLSCLDQGPPCSIEVGVYGVGPASAGRSCLTNADTKVGQTHEGRFNWFIDGKARPMAVVCPARHSEHLSDMATGELLEFWESVGVLIRTLGISFHEIIVNQGTYRNLAHLHAKIWFAEEEFMEALRARLPQKFPVWEELDALYAVLDKPQPAAVMAKLPLFMERAGVPRVFVRGVPAWVSCADLAACLEGSGFEGVRVVGLPDSSTEGRGKNHGGLVPSNPPSPSNSAVSTATGASSSSFPRAVSSCRLACSPVEEGKGPSPNEGGGGGEEKGPEGEGGACSRQSTGSTMTLSSLAAAAAVRARTKKPSNSCTLEFPLGAFEEACRTICELHASKPFGGSQRLFVKWVKH